MRDDGAYEARVAVKLAPGRGADRGVPPWWQVWVGQDQGTMLADDIEQLASDVEKSVASRVSGTD
jgi:hypothetical protein